MWRSAPRRMGSASRGASPGGRRAAPVRDHGGLRARHRRHPQHGARQRAGSRPGLRTCRTGASASSRSRRWRPTSQVSSSGGAVGVGQRIAAGRADWSHWANTLADTLPGGAAQSLVRTIQTGQLDTVRENLSGKQQAAIEYGVGALAGGVTRFVFGRDVVDAARVAFADAPEDVPGTSGHSGEGKAEADDVDVEPNRALAALEDAAKATGTGSPAPPDGRNRRRNGRLAVGTGVATAAEHGGAPFRSVDLDGDGIPDAPQALTAVKGVGGAIAGAAGAVGGSVAGLFRSRKRSGRGDASGPVADQRPGESEDGAAVADQLAESHRNLRGSAARGVHLRLQRVGRRGTALQSARPCTAAPRTESKIGTTGTLKGRRPRHVEGPVTSDSAGHGAFGCEPPKRIELLTFSLRVRRSAD